MSSDDRRFRDDERRDSQRSGQPQADAGGSGSAPPRASPGSLDVWRASASFGWLIGVALQLLIGAGIVLSLARVPSSTGGQRVAWILIALVLTALAIGVAVLLRALPTMRYRFTDDSLVVEWLGRQRVVPLAEIEDVTFDPHQPLRLPRWEPFWPGYYVATVRTPAGTWHTWATQQPRRRVRLTTAHGIVAISPERPVRFMAELERRRRIAGQSTVQDANAAHIDSSSPNADLPLRSDQFASRRDAPPPAYEEAEVLEHRDDLRATSNRSRSPRPSHNSIVAWASSYRDLFREQLLLDQVASACVAAGVVLPVLMVAYLYSQFEGLPDQIPISWDATGAVSEQTSPDGLWRFPRMAVIILVVNTALATLLVSVDRYLARLLLAGVPLAQLILFIALIRAVN